MFERILIKPQLKIGGNHVLNIENLVDMMLYYQEVHIIISHIELSQLLSAFGEEVLLELVKSKRIILHPCCQHVGSGIIGDSYSIGLYSQNFNIHQMLYEFHHKIEPQNTDKNRKFADIFAKYLSAYKYPSFVNDKLFQDMDDVQFLRNATEAYLKQYFPTYKNTCESIEISAKSNQNFGGFYQIESNLDIPQLNQILQKQGYSHKFGYEGLLLSIGETCIDCYNASNMKSELFADPRYTEIYKIRLNTNIERANDSYKNIEHFSEAFSYGFLSLGKAFTKKIILPAELLDKLNDNNSRKFRDWLSKLPEDAKLTGEFYNECEDRLSQKGITKGIRFGVTTAAGFIPSVGVAVSALDQFVVDRIIDGWKPKIFLDKILRDKKLSAK